jgi:hypothetical protein
MQDDTEKQAIRNLIQVADEPAMRPNFEDRLTKAWLEKSRENAVPEESSDFLHALTLPLQQWRWGLALFVFGLIGFGYWHHLRELEDLRQFDLLLEFSMGTL